MIAAKLQSLTVTLMSYNGELRLAMGTEKGFIDSQLLVSCIKNAFNRIMDAALAIKPTY